ncbi:epoxide hydrolase [Moelleriella libera RCEF 2490]|uniref:Epoxide hydrolase n=1 Tax=Moelleriella libera RCEF 2490 TaxID=1081109 RepID=A0A162IVF9_9HYPO|nr:epoxide hydrolase [Moelleriella libera RCEF 2490]
MDTSKLVPHDPRVCELSAQVRGKTYTYLLGEPPQRTAPAAHTIFLLHGFPDHSFGWRYQVPYLMALGHRVVVPNLLGYGGTSRPDDLASFSMKNMSLDLKHLAAHIVGPDEQIIIGGHDWGGFFAWRVVLWQPELVKAVFSCTPFDAPCPPGREYISLQDKIAAGELHNFKYMLSFVGPEVEEAIQTKAQLRCFINGVFRGPGPNGEQFFTIDRGFDLANVESYTRQSPLVDEAEVEYYTEEYLKHPLPWLRGPLNWYRTRKMNFDDELVLADKFDKIKVPALFIAATHDAPLPLSLSKDMDRHFQDLTRCTVETSHWSLWEAHEDVNLHIGRWLKKVVGCDGDIQSHL